MVTTMKLTRDDLKSWIESCPCLRREPFGRFHIEMRLNDDGKAFIVIDMGNDGFDTFVQTPNSATHTASMLGCDF